jgi:hypothetical protein
MGRKVSVITVLNVRYIFFVLAFAFYLFITEKSLNVCLFQTTFASRFVAGDPKAAEFREFWGERSQLRRFQDGVVKEVVVWGDKKEEVVGKSEEKSSLHLLFPSEMVLILYVLYKEVFRIRMIRIPCQKSFAFLSSIQRRSYSFDKHR